MGKEMSNMFRSRLDATLGSRALILAVILMTALGIWGGPSGNDVRDLFSTLKVVAVNENIPYVNSSDDYSIATNKVVSCVSSQ